MTRSASKYKRHSKLLPCQHFFAPLVAPSVSIAWELGMTSTQSIDAKVFSRHFLALKKAWNASSSSFDGFAFISGVTGASVNKTLALQFWLFGYELTDTLLAVTETSVYVLCTVNKAKLLEAMKKDLDSEINLTVMTLNKKDPNQTTTQFETIIKALKASNKGQKIGTFLKESTGPFVENWNAAVESSNTGFNLVDSSDFLSELLSIKTPSEQKCTRTAATISVSILRNFLVKKFEKVIQDEQNVTHKELSDKSQEFFNDPTKISKQLTADVVESCYTPIIQSKNHDLSLMASSSAGNLQFGIIICSLGARYKFYGSDVARTYLIDPSKEQEEAYKAALSAHEALLAAMKPGVTLSSLYNTAKDRIKSQKPELVAKLLSSCGAATGLEYADLNYSITATNEKKLAQGMIFIVRLGLQDIQDPAKGKYSILITDTVLIGANGGEILTDKATKKYNDVAYDMDQDKDDSEEAPKGQKKSKQESTRKLVIDATETKEFSLRRTEMIDSIQVGQRAVRKTIARDLMSNNSNSEAKRADHQVQLHKDMMKAAKKALKTKKEGSGTSKAPVSEGPREFISYKSAKEFPLDQPDAVHVDTSKETVLVPIYGQLVPYHITTIKQVTKTEEFLRITFKFPGGTPQNQPEKPKTELFAEPAATFVKEMTFRIPNANSLNTSFRLISELKKRVTSRETEIHQKLTLKVQPALILSRTGNIPRLQHLTIRPVLGGKRTTGTLEAHTNGFRFVSRKSGNVDIIYDNVKHCFFQPSDNSVIVVLHFHLHSEIMIGKKKTQDIQFFAEVMDASEAVSGPSRNQPRWGDVEEIEEEQHQRELSKRLNAEFKNFVKKVEDLEGIDLEFDIPYKELGFYGVPNRNNLFLQPTVHCLINVIEVPFFVLCLAEVQIAYFERVQFSLRNFDLVFVFKDWSAKEVHVNSIPVENLEAIKDWLDNSNIKYYVGKTNLQWRTLLDRISKNPQKFWDDGGWDVLKESESASESGSEEGPSDYSPSKSDSSDYEMRESSSASEGDSSGGYSDQSGSGDENDDSEGLDWDDLEEVATKHDQKKAQKRGREEAYDSDEEATSKKRKMNHPPARPKPTAPPTYKKKPTGRL